MADYREGTYTAQDGLKLYYRDYGDLFASRTPVLCLSGLARSSIDFAHVASRLARQRRVICPDYRGRGRSDYDKDWRNYEPRTYIMDILDLLAVTGIERAVIIGTSLGGLLAMGLAVLQPTLLAGVVLNDIGPELTPGGLDRIIDYIGTDHVQPDWESAVGFLRVLLPRLAPGADDAWWRTLAEGTYRGGADGRLHFNWDTAIAKPMRQQPELPDLWALFRALKPVPTLLLRGELSDLLSDDTMRRMALEKTDLACVTVPERGHTPALDEPLSERALDDFLASF
ncbi:MAG TPA: alpha/beta hydrolase [Stellaceae bacterium]|nr:alpha/beta hydrolase [Stellaceae bacterium]